MTDTQLATRAEEPSGSLGNMLAIIERASRDPNIDVDKMERLLAMGERMEAKHAIREFNAAFAKMQADIPQIVATSIIPNRGKYERFEDVMRQIQPVLTDNGFSVQFSQLADEKRITVTCHLRHTLGHSSDTSFAVRLGGKADSETQADCKASTTAKRNSLLQALNIVVRQDALQDEDDPRNESDICVSQNQADGLREMCDESHSDRSKFLAFAGAGTFEAIPLSRYDDLVALLNKKRNAK